MGTAECSNCGTDFASDRPVPYCSVRCEATARTVRDARRWVSAGWNPTERPQGLNKSALLSLMIDNAIHSDYSRNRRRFPPGRREEIIRRDGGLCVLCGKPGEHVDHIKGNSCEPINLRLLCVPCHMHITATIGQPANPNVLTPTQADALTVEIRRRIVADTPTRPCDDHETWKSHRQRWARQHFRKN